jgi:Leucine-rich repeat (LRR) protein
MRDGNVFVGEITRYESGIITIKTEYGTFNLDDSKVKYITVSESELKGSYKEPCVVLKDGKVIPGKISSYISVLKRVKVSSNYGDIIIDRFKDIALIVLEPTVTVDLSLSLVTFADPNLEQAVRNALGIPAGQPITRADMTRLTSLEASRRDIQNLSGLEYAINLQKLFLFWNHISDISPLANLTNLQGLYLSGNRISDISPLVSNTGLGPGDTVQLEKNPLDLTPGSDDMQNIQILQNRGVTVVYY